MKSVVQSKYISQWHLWYEKPAKSWEEALPLGNGRIGLMAYGNTHCEKMNISEATCYSGEASMENCKRGAYKYIPMIREALFSGDYEKANDLCSNIIGLKKNYGTNLPVGNIIVNYSYENQVIKDYSRSLDLKQAISIVKYKVGDVRYIRKEFVSNPDQVAVLYIKSDKKGSVNFSIEYDGGENPAHITLKDEDLVFIGKAYESIHSDGKSGVSYYGRIRIVTVDGSVHKGKNRLSVVGATEALILFAVNTDFNGDDPELKSKQQLDKASLLSYEQLFESHLKDYQDLYNRFLIELGEYDESIYQIPTDERLNKVKEGKEDISLTALMFQYARYLFISSSRQNSPLPAHLQGVWNDNIACRIGWTCDMHLDINTQMNYWLAEPTNLLECSNPLFKWIQETIVPSGRRTAKDVYGLNGWVAHTVSNAWGYTAPGWSVDWGIYPTAGVWIATHLWQHYEFTKDENFLKNDVYPVFREMVIFFLDYLAEDPQTGCLVCGPSCSPENHFIAEDGKTYANSMGTTCDTVLVRELFNNYMDMCDVLNSYDDLFVRVKDAVNKLPYFKIGQKGQLQEWYYDFEEAKDNHRHTSHLLSIYPFGQIDPYTTPELGKAARISIERRYNSKQGWEDTGWARSLLILYMARLADGEEAWNHILSMQRSLTTNNLMVFHPPVAGAHSKVYELDGNTGLCAGIVEMLLQSHNGEIRLLPALPLSWKRGKVKGLRARGGLEFDLEWEDGKLKDIKIYAHCDCDSKICYKGKNIEVNMKKGESKNLNNFLI